MFSQERTLREPVDMTGPAPQHVLAKRRGFEQPRILTRLLGVAVPTIIHN